MANRTLAKQLEAVSENDQGTHRVAIVIQYQGTHFHGWQRQPEKRTVQAEIETAIASLLGARIPIHGAGRTDTGVHAAAQVAHFDAPKVIPVYRWAAILNHRLSEDIVIRASARVPDDWHAQYSAQWRRYRYTIYTDAYPNLFVRPYAWHFYHEPLDDQLMQSALTPMVGYHELTAFHRAGSSRAHSWVELQAAKCSRFGPFVQVELQAAGFLYGMVRLVMGLLVRVGRGHLTPTAFTELWQSGRRDLVKHAAPPRGLCLLRVGYQHFPFAPDAWFDTQPQLTLHSTAENLAV
ncbi:tRNA pseudouridine(38-40) synthase TruA [Leptolyngbya cf. ectocarpi LEGE 11479]|uniref:tRNA pseudouridine synthase A n=1 Tax=Leptolyngbya cf. ectocarpi LEGE 11479 TaxID=1828722 RepID=A0A928ZYB8_LEPEC|nr:tRNA pseudouridine(38-40) synthase TruA [Leptolyngbya ectocarpi]MBE9069676.1 tRNA pseudouridine(38-40) synthase TruA [Leptolyngbya cf. ectocarpi LEGE 11479]